MTRGTGTCSITATRAGDTNYNDVTSAAVSVTANPYSWSNYLQPINTSGTRSQFKLNSTIPVKFKLTGDSASVTNAVAKLSWKKVSSGTSGETEAVATNSPDSGNTFRYDSVEGQYIFNLGTKSMGEGTFMLSIDLGDGVTTRTVEITIRK